MDNMISGALFRKMMLNAAAVVDSRKKVLNELNVYPVPDGDTGTNMSMTLSYCSRELVNISEDSIGKISEKISTALIRGSHGNSGVITSLLFGGMAKKLKGFDSASQELFAEALKAGSEKAYSVVNRPAEGTILTVSRVASEKAVEIAGKLDNTEFFETVLQAAQKALELTPKQNPVLEKAGVVDAGGKGYVFILEGMLSAVKGEEINLSVSENTSSQKTIFDDFKTEDIRFSYCTEFIIIRSSGKESESLREYLSGMGDCLVLVDDEGMIKIHVHTNNPGTVLEKALEYGALTSIKIENMREQHTAKLFSDENENKSEDDEPVEMTEEYGFVAVGAGEGIYSVFRDLGVTGFVQGGQTMNPSTEDILQAINKTPAKNVFVLPNNKNIILAAQQTVSLTDRNVIVVPTRTIPEGITAIMCFDPSATPEDNLEAMTEGYSNVRTGLITYAARDSEFDGIRFKAGDYLALAGSKFSSTGKNLADVVSKLADDLDVSTSDVITVFCGCDAEPIENTTVRDTLKMKADSLTEISIMNGGQPVYYYIIGVE